jgi:hypothetical protein
LKPVPVDRFHLRGAFSPGSIIRRRNAKTATVDDMATPTYRIEHHRDDAAALIIGFRGEADRPQMILAPFADRLLAEGRRTSSG